MTLCEFLVPEESIRTNQRDRILKASWLGSPLGPVLAIADEEVLYLLEFAECSGLEREIERLRRKIKCVFIRGQTKPIDSIQGELDLYFAGNLTAFKTPLFLQGTPFQRRVWEELMKIPFGETRSYSQIATNLNKPTAFRAVAQAISSNQHAIIIPCHRVIKANGELCGYAGGIARKQGLLSLEKTPNFCS
jgi:AraC family transcriptional regulator, regulatory protein of adaptative response / methylated-DNA-[protein]-cysteine methyltransferase